MPGNLFCTDCQAVQKQCQKSHHELIAARQKLARAWAPISLYLECTGSDNVVWMPAHTAEHDVGVLRLSDGQPLSEEDRAGNDEADRLAKDAVEAFRVPPALRSALSSYARKVIDVATWIGRATLAANEFETWQVRDGSVVKILIRDAEATPKRNRASKIRGSAKTAGTAARPAPGFPGCAKWEALKARVLLRASQRSQDSTQEGSVTASVAAVANATAMRPPPAGVASRKYRVRSRPQVVAASSGAARVVLRASSSHSPALRPPAGSGPRPAQECSDESLALRDLRELQECGLHVVWDDGSCTGVSSSTQQVARTIGEPAHCEQPTVPEAKPAAELTAALKDLEELHRCGLPVVWPEWATVPPQGLSERR